MNQEQSGVLEFGTGGIRGIMGPDANHMNEHSIKRVALGFCQNINATLPEAEKERGVAIAYDSRHNSCLFAKIAAAVFASNQIPVFIFDDIETTPMLSFAIRHLNCVGGLCITASHNPPQYNGIKVYGSDGAQIVPPQDESITEYINNIPPHEDGLSLNTESEFASALENGKIKYVHSSIQESYFKDLFKTICPTRQDFSSSDLSIVYTPLHGTGLKPVTKLLKLLHFTNVFVVPEQAQPDGEFPTVKRPNPEESEALSLAIQYALERNADIIFATDPDSDRLAVCIKDTKRAQGIYQHQSKGDYVLLNGNQTSALLLNFILSSMQAENTLHTNHKIIKTMVTTGLLEHICHSYGVDIFQTPTGFKWIASLIRQWEISHPDYRFLFGAEESFGYMLSNNVRDKDAIAALACVVQMAALLKTQNRTLCDALFDLFQKFGAWQEDLLCFEFEPTAEGMEKIQTIMKHFRNTSPHSFAGIRVNQKIDYLTVEAATDEETFCAKLNVLQFMLTDESVVSIRPSGTEPKLKIYVSACAKHDNIDEALQQTHDKIRSLRYDLLTQVQQSISL